MHAMGRKAFFCFFSESGTRKLPFAATTCVSFLLAACGTEQPQQGDVPTPESSFAAEYHCPKGSSYETSSRLCIAGEEAVGPFTVAMQRKCQEQGGGSVCTGTRWNAEFTRRLRGAGACMNGAVGTARGLCVEGNDAYGPFTITHVKNCLAKGGGLACDSMRMGRSFAEATLPGGSNTWAYLAATDFGIRSDSGGDGAYRAARGGGRRVHRGIDFLYPLGTPLLAPCAGTAKTGNDPNGYGSYVVVTCTVPAEIAGNGSYTASFLYGHLASVSVRSGSAVGRGARIGTVGKSGNAAGFSINAHVHFEAMVADAARFNELDFENLNQEAMETEAESFSTASTESMATFLGALQSRCTGPRGFRATRGLSYANTVDPFVLLNCLAAKPAVRTPAASLQQRLIPWSAYYSAADFNVDTGTR